MAGLLTIGVYLAVFFLIFLYCKFCKPLNEDEEEHNNEEEAQPLVNSQ
jgi:hypothetical protein